MEIELFFIPLLLRIKYKTDNGINEGDSPDDGAHVASPSGEQVQLNTLAATTMLAHL